MIGGGAAGTTQAQGGKTLALSPRTAADIDHFLDAAWMERGLSDNTLAAYRNDLRDYATWLAASSRDLLESQPADILAYLASMAAGSARTSSRRLSALRQFFQRQTREGRIGEDPTAHIDMPRIGRPLPKSLTESEVEALLAAPVPTLSPTCLVCGPSQMVKLIAVLANHYIFVPLLPAGFGQYR